ncbi:MAG TPA: Gfo/Idh/MocA family oxidoreductase [Lacunisphaera sp.]
MSAPRTALIGIGGYGRVHLQHLLDFHRRGELVLAMAVAFPPEPDAAVLAELRAVGCTVLDSFEALLAALPGLRVDFAVVPTPIHLHARMTVALMRAGVDVLVEKPLAATMEDAALIMEEARTTGRSVAVGFQYLHAPEVRALKQHLLEGAIGSLRRLVVHAAWPRSHSYYARNAWAGQLKVGEDWVLDSPVSNAMSHFLMVMLYLAGSKDGTLARPVRLAAELYRAQEIESFDTAALHFETADGLRLDFYGTHSSSAVGRPSLRIEGTGGSAEWAQDAYARLHGTVGTWEQQAAPESNTRERMLRDVLARRRDEPVMVCTPAMAAVHVHCFTALHRLMPIRSIAADHLANHSQDGQRFTYVMGLDAILAEAARTGQSLAEAGAPWAVQATEAHAFKPMA